MTSIFLFIYLFILFYYRTCVVPVSLFLKNCSYNKVAFYKISMINKKLPSERYFFFMLLNLKKKKKKKKKKLK